MHPVRKAAEDWEAEAIERTRNNPAFMATGMCPACVMDRPCICDKNVAIRKMRDYYEAHRRNLFRREPVGYANWGQKYDVLMTELYMIAKNEILHAQEEQHKTRSANGQS